MNSRLLEVPSELEVKQVVFSMAPMKAPGPDGMTPLFYQKYWEVLKVDIVRAVAGFFENGNLLSKFNHTNIVLIPKIPTPILVSHFWPISLCNVSYRIIAKVMTNRLKGIIESIISESQSAFIAGRHITDNILITHEILHYLKNKWKGRNAFLAPKLDMSKAYNRVEWDFLFQILHHLGLNSIWIKMISACASTISYSLKINRASIGFFHPSRGLRQGDPLSPYLFILCAEAFSLSLLRAQQACLLFGVQICKGAPSVSHLFFADDSSIFCTASESEVWFLKHILIDYERASGQQVNFAKSSIFFSKNTSPDNRRLLSALLGLPEEGLQAHYLGVPAIVGRSKRDVFHFLLDQLQDHLSSWKAQTLSSGGKEWCNKGKSRSIHWVHWDLLCRSKKLGGLGFRDLEAFNLALLTKHAWNFQVRPHGLAFELLKTKYFPNSSILDARLGYNPSWGWRSIWSTQPILRRGLHWLLGNGKTIRIWQDHWVPDFSDLLPRPMGAVPFRLVEDLFCLYSGAWKVDLLRQLFSPMIVQKNLQLHISRWNMPDTLICAPERHGGFSVRSAYIIARSFSNPITVSLDNFSWRVFDGVLWGPETVVAKAVASFWEFQATRSQCVLLTAFSPSSSAGSWVPPADGMVKCNIDASFLPQSFCGNEGAVFRDSHGVILYVVVFRPFIASSALMAEAIACLERFFRLLQLDCDVYVLNLTLRSFDVASLVHIHRSGNRLAHAIAMMFRHASPIDYELLPIPSQLSDLARLEALDLLS
ncbi:uncharacterized protein LOC132270192 [Cornus florida]|uniref:uncharacterized protein LOC132270192 n=1 Tax=Cornus florida TaxID=4283 RepID=UPI0028983EB8|nr:uncharacterized protein LOC132270192 [Cornus florida]